MVLAGLGAKHMAAAAQVRSGIFYGWRVVGAAFVLGAFGWGIGFFGPPVFLSVVCSTRGWPLVLVSSAVSFHFLVGAVTGAKLERLHRRFGAAAVTKTGAACLAVGVLGWATVTAPWQLFVTSVLSGVGWGAMSAAALNAIVSPWFVRARPAALGMAYNGGSLGGVIFSPLWVAAIGILGFPVAAAVVGAFMTITIWILAGLVFSRTPQQMGLLPDGELSAATARSVTSPNARPLPGASLGEIGGFSRSPPAWGWGCLHRSVSWLTCSRCSCQHSALKVRALPWDL